MHVVLVPLVLICSALHFPIKYWWPTAAGGLWIAERVWRFLRYGWVNGWWGGLGNGERRERTPKGAALEAKRIRPETGFVNKGDEQWEMEHVRDAAGQDGLGVAQGDILSQYAYTSPTSPTSNRPFQLPSPSLASEFGERSSAIDPGYSSSYTKQPAYSQPIGSFSTWGDDKDVEDSGYTPEPLHPNSVLPRGAAPQARATASMPRAPSSFSLYSHRVPQVARPIRAAIPAGYALAQLLPSRMIRLTLRVPKPFRWAPGQNVLLQIREISIWQSHPFSIVSVYDADVEQEVVLLVKARKGFTNELWKETRRRMDAQPDEDGDLRPPTAYNAPIAMSRSGSSRGSFYFASSSTKLSTRKPVFFRALVDGPYGSAARVRWGSHASVLIIAGGSGVSFAVAILTYVCECMASRDKLGLGAAGKGGRGFVTQRVRFVWIVRDFGSLHHPSPFSLSVLLTPLSLSAAEILWVSNLLRRCMDLVPATQLSIDIFVTNYSASEKSVYLLGGTSKSQSVDGELAPPRPLFAKGGVGRDRSNSSESLDSTASVDSNVDLAYLADQETARGALDSDDRNSVLELTNWDEDMDDEEDERTPAERSLSLRVKKEGRIRRAKSRKRAAAKQQLPGVDHSQFPLPSTDSKTSFSVEDDGSHTPQRVPFGQRSPGGGTFPSSASAGDGFSSPAPHTVRSPSGLRVYNARNSIGSMTTAESAGFDGAYATQNGSRSDFGPGPESHTDHSFVSGAESTRRLVGGAWDEHRQSFVRVDVEGEDKDQFMDEGDEEDLNIVAEMARPGRPLLDKIMKEEVDIAEGMIAIACELAAGLGWRRDSADPASSLVAACGPSSLNSTIRNVRLLAILLCR